MLRLTDNQFTPYARTLAALVIQTRLDTLRDNPNADEPYIRGQMRGIQWVCDQVGIPLDDIAEDNS